MRKTDENCQIDGRKQERRFVENVENVDKQFISGKKSQ